MRIRFVPRGATAQPGPVCVLVISTAVCAPTPVTQKTNSVALVLTISKTFPPPPPGIATPTLAAVASTLAELTPGLYASGARLMLAGDLGVPRRLGAQPLGVHVHDLEQRIGAAAPFIQLGLVHQHLPVVLLAHIGNAASARGRAFEFLPLFT